MAQSNDRHRLKQALCVLIINALLLTQQGLLFQALAQTVVEGPKTVSGTGSVGVVGASLGSASSLSGANLVPAGTVLNLSQTALGAVPTVLPQSAIQPLPAPALAPVAVQPLILAAPEASAVISVPANAETSVRLAKVNPKVFQPI